MILGLEIDEFTGKERDAETGLDFFQAKYMAAAQGRFTSPDPLIGRPDDPQSWNMYAYGRNNPLLYPTPMDRVMRFATRKEIARRRTSAIASLTKFGRTTRTSFFPAGKFSTRMTTAAAPKLAHTGERVMIYQTAALAFSLGLSGEPTLRIN
ncbi:MAG TPA: RHS repeat-associated core domain-containing protein [Bryobacteraceae bacterium]|nr:RHS repeat-associated core domain-containing protein [Bryobacteraceae bacterium]